MKLNKEGEECKKADSLKRKNNSLHSVWGTKLHPISTPSAQRTKCRFPRSGKEGEMHKDPKSAIFSITNNRQKKKRHRFQSFLTQRKSGENQAFTRIKKGNGPNFPCHYWKGEEGPGKTLVGATWDRLSEAALRGASNLYLREGED